MIKNFSVPNPCHEKWDGMAPKDNGRYCTSCQKVVVDFTNKSNQEIIDYISANAGKKMCGTFKSSQLPPSPYSNKKLIRFLAALLLTFGLSLFSCAPDTANKPTTAEDAQVTTGIIIPPQLPIDTTMQQPTETTETSATCTTTGDISIVTVDPVIEETLDAPPVVGAIVPFIAETMPEFEGGNIKLTEYLRKNIQYPPEASREGIEGLVAVTFVVKKDGSIDDVQILKGIGYGCDEEAVRIVKNMPKWKPGKNGMEATDIRFNLPIRFKLK